MNKQKEAKKAYCDICGDYVEYGVKKVKNKITVRGVTFEAIEHIAYCKKCGEELWVNEVERINDINVYDKYKELVGLLTSKQIKEIRHKRNMSQRELASFLSIGEKDITRYENGAIQSKVIDNLIRMVGDENIYIYMQKLLQVTETIEKTIYVNDYPIICDQTAYIQSNQEKRGKKYGKRIWSKDVKTSINEYQLCY